jgi:hypothetical protein
MLFQDRSPMGTRKKLDNGFLQVDAVLARTGIQVYSAGELGLTARPRTDAINVWRPASEVFAPESMASFAMVPMTDDHPDDMVTDENAKELTVGYTGENVARVGDVMKTKLVVSDRAVIAKLEANKKSELSNGYTSDIDWTPGVVPEGEVDAGKSYDCVQRNIRGNHVALVDAGRCGAACRVLDTLKPKIEASDCSCNHEGESTMADKALTSKFIDGFGKVELSDDAVMVIDKLQADLKAAKDAASALAGEQAVKDKAAADALTAKDAEITTLKAATLDQTAMDARVAGRTKLVADARLVGGADLVVDGKTDLEVQKDAVTKALGDDATKDQEDAFFPGAFAALAVQAAKDGKGPTRQEPDALKDALRPNNNNNDAAKTPSYEERQAARWKGAK